MSVEEKMPSKRHRLVVGAGKYGSLPVMHSVNLEARRGKIDLQILPTDEAIETLAKKLEKTMPFSM